jgi:pyruvate,water dikinase
MTRSVMLPACNNSFRVIFAEYGMLLDGIEFREFGGWVYNRLVPMGGKDRKAAPPKWLFWLLVRAVPEIRKRVALSQETSNSDLAYRQVAKWHDEWKADQIRRIAELSAVDRAALDERELLAHFRESFVFADESIERHFRLVPPGLMLAELAFFLQERLGWDDVRVFSLFAGLSYASTEPSRQLASLAKMAADRPGLRAAIADGSAAKPGALAKLDPEFAAAFADYQARFGCRALRYEFAEATLEEAPEITLGLIADQVARGYDPEREAQKATERREAGRAEARAALKPEDVAEFDRLLARADHYYPVREDNEFYTVSAPMALFRYACLALGERLAALGLLESAGDVFWLEYEEACRALPDEVDNRALAARRKEEHAHAAANPGPATYGEEPGPPPPFEVLPGPVATSTRAVFWMSQRVFEEQASQRKQSGATIQGVAGAPGEVTAPARVVLGEEDFDKIEPGDVLVCPITSPVWSVIFPSVSALVTNSGGIMSHPAIIAREFGIPAVVATGNATELLKDGQMVRVDGNRGVVSVVG